MVQRTRPGTKPRLEELEGRWLPSNILVTTTADSGPGSLRQAILDANGQKGTDRILFQVGTGAVTISPLAPLPAVTDAVIIDGTAQPGYAGVPLVELSGNRLPSSPAAEGLDIQAAGCTVRGLVINRFPGTGIVLEGGANNTTIAGNFIGTDATGLAAAGNGQNGLWLSGSSGDTIGGITPLDRNVLSGNRGNGILIEGGDQNFIAANFIGVNAAGTTALGNAGDGINDNGGTHVLVGAGLAGLGNVIAANLGNGVTVVNAAGVKLLANLVGTDANGDPGLGNGGDGVLLTSAADTIGGTSVADANVLSGNQGDGVNLSGSGTAANLIEGNYIGTGPGGTTALGNAGNGVALLSARNNTVGGVDPGPGNVISANGGDGVLVGGPGASGNVIEGNALGTDATEAQPLGNLGAGVEIQDGSSATVGGTEVGAGNVIAFNTGAGVAVTGGTGAAMRGNSIFGNRLGIDLGNNGVTLNDSTGHSGPNNYQNFPLLTYAVASPTSLLVRGTLSSTPDTTFTLDFYTNVAADPTGYGQGQSYAGSATVTTDAAGNAGFSVALPVRTGAGQFVSAAATDPGGNTSEFDPCLVAHGTDTWTGLGNDRNWSDPANWNTPPSAGDALVFPTGAASLVTNNDLGTVSFYSLYFADAYTVTGNTLHLTGGVTAALPGGTVTLQATVSLDDSQVFTAAGSDTVLDLAAGLTGGVALALSGPGTVRVEGVSSNDGTTTVNGGTFLVMGIYPDSVVVGGGVLAGTGRLGTVYLAAGSLAPSASSPGTLSAGTTAFAPGSFLSVGLNNPQSGVASGAFAAAGPVDLGGANLAVSLGFPPAGSQSFTILTSPALSGTFRNVANGSLLTVGQSEFQVSYTANSVVLTHVPAARLQWSGPTSTTAGTPLGLTLTALDAFGNVVHDFTGTVTLASADPLFGQPVTYPFTSGAGGDDGSHLFTLTLGTAGIQTVSATDAADGLTTDQSVTVSPAPFSRFAIADDSGPATAGLAQAFTVTAQDAFGNVVSGFAGTVAPAASDLRALLPGPYTFQPADDGSHRFFPVVWETAGSQTFSVTGASGVTASLPVLVFPGAVAGLAVTAPAAVYAGLPFSVTVTARDAYGNTVPGYTDTVRFGSTDAAAGVALPGPYTFGAADAGQHVFSYLFTLQTPGTQTITVTDTSASLPGTSGPIGVNVPGTNVLFLAGLYRDLLGRPADPAGLAYFQPPLDSALAGGFSQAATQILASAEYKGDLAGNILRRFLPADDSNLAYIQFCSSELTILADEQVIAQVVGSDEYYQDQGGTDRGWLQALYPALLGRPLDQAGQNYFGGLLGAGVSRQAVAAQILASPEYQGDLVESDYQKYLGHAAPADGLSYFGGLLQSGQTDELLVADFLASGEYYQHRGSSNDRWLAGVYQDLLNRAVDPAGQAYFGGLVNAALAGPLGATVTQFVQSREHEGDLVNGYYQQYLGHAVSAADLSGYWYGQFDVSQTYEQLQAQILGSAEYFVLNGSDNSRWLTQVYQQALGRPLDQGGQDYFLPLLTGGASRASVALLILNSQEHQTLAIRQTYQSYLGRPASASDLGYWLAQYQAGLTTAGFLVDVLQSQEYYRSV